MKTRDQMNTIFFSKEKIETEERMCMMHTHTLTQWEKNKPLTMGLKCIEAKIGSK